MAARTYKEADQKRRLLSQEAKRQKKVRLMDMQMKDLNFTRFTFYRLKSALGGEGLTQIQV